MHLTNTAKSWSVIIIVLLSTTHILCVPSYLDYENARDLYELLLQKQLVRENLNPAHQITRKSARSPSLRLRFGKRMDPFIPMQSLLGRVQSTDDSQQN